MNKNPIIIVGGEPNSVFSEILINSYEKSKKNKPIILFASHKLFLKQLSILNIKSNFNLIDLKKYDFKNLSYKKINICNIDYNFKKPFEKISAKSNKYISICFTEALKFSKKNEISGFINGPISKKFFLGKKFLGITEYLASKKKN